MATMPHDSSTRAARPEWLTRVVVTEMWASLAIVSMWIAVVIDSVFGPDIVSTNGAGTQSTTVPSGVVLAFFAVLGTYAVARRGFGRDPGS
jgi:hypothetical protein